MYKILQNDLLMEEAMSKLFFAVGFRRFYRIFLFKINVIEAFSFFLYNFQVREKPFSTRINKKSQCPITIGAKFQVIHY